ncbi:MAG: nucleotide exchange factor GrpE [Ruminococcus sp.]|nr:nucleotide exchange factor GrpE [Ruminococcus sp.]
MDKELEKEAVTEEKLTEETKKENLDETTEQAAADDTDEQEPETAEESAEVKLQKELDEQKDKYLRLLAEYDNFRKRSAKERLELMETAKGDAVSEILPVLDNFERALGTETQDEAYKSGVEMIFKQFGDALSKLGVEVIDPTGQEFDPNIANAVNQIEDENLGENVVAQTFQKGYKVGGRVIRYAMVVVANP